MAEESKAELRYDTELDVDELNREVDTIWEELRANGELTRRASVAGAPSDALLSARRDEVLTIRQRGSGFEPGTTAILVAIAGPIAAQGARVAADVVRDVWTQILLPRLRARFGTGAVVTTDSRGQEGGEKAE
jgi:hypothetical protein